MAKDGGVNKYDPNTEAFQMRAQWKKVDICRKQWFERWSWLLDERRQALLESDAIRQEAADALPHGISKLETTKTLKPVPITSTGVIGWLAAKFVITFLLYQYCVTDIVYQILIAIPRPDCQLEIYKSWLSKIPLKLPDAWDDKSYVKSESALKLFPT